MNRIWRVKNAKPDLSVSLASTLDISPITAQILINRGIGDEMQAHHFLYGDISSCHDPHLLKDLDRAVARTKKAVKEKENILVYTDYDVDGITSASILYKALSFLGAKVTTYIPNRLEEGYGLNLNAVKIAHRKKISLIITADCGISAKKEVELANKLKIDVIITDHHEIKTEDLPQALATINPLQKDCRYPFKHLSGVGLAYKFAKALLEGTSYPIDSHLDLVALGTVSDLSVQKGENRILTKSGLKELTVSKNKGIRALIDVAGLTGKDISCGHIGYILGPRINAMGRIGAPDVALKLLITDDDKEARDLAGILNRENRNRQNIERRVMDEAMDKVEREVNFAKTRVIVLSGSGWHAGVIGIVASRVVEKFYRPTILVAFEGKDGKGSGRSIDNFNIFEAVSACKNYLRDFGGHEGACGLRIEKKNIEKFSEEINKYASQNLRDEDMYPALDIDAEISLSQLSEKLIGELELLVPFGPENPRPVFSSNNMYLKNEPRRIARNGFKFLVTDDRTTCEAISFRPGAMSFPPKGSKVSLVYSPSINTWQGIASIQLDLKDVKMVE